MFSFELGIFDMVYALGMNGGSGVMALLFHAIGPKTTLFWYFISSAIIFICLLVYIDILPTLDDYEKLCEDKDGEDNDGRTAYIHTYIHTYIHIYIHILFSSLLNQNMVVNRLEHAWLSWSAWTRLLTGLNIGHLEHGCWQPWTWSMKGLNLVVDRVEHGCWKAWTWLLTALNMHGCWQAWTLGSLNMVVDIRVHACWNRLFMLDERTDLNINVVNNMNTVINQQSCSCMLEHVVRELRNNKIEQRCYKRQWTYRGGFSVSQISHATEVKNHYKDSTITQF